MEEIVEDEDRDEVEDSEDDWIDMKADNSLLTGFIMGYNKLTIPLETLDGLYDWLSNTEPLYV